MMTDPIADMLTRIRNAQAVGKKTVELQFSKIKFQIAKILVEEGYLAKADKRDGKPAMLVLNLKYNGKIPAIQSLKRESKPGHRVYRKTNEISRVLNDYGVAIVSTSQGIMTNKEARKKAIGGEIICSVY